MNEAWSRPETSYQPAPTWTKKCFVGRQVRFGWTRYSPNRAWEYATPSSPSVSLEEIVYHRFPPANGRQARTSPSDPARSRAGFEPPIPGIGPIIDPPP